MFAFCVFLCFLCLFNYFLCVFLCFCFYLFLCVFLRVFLRLAFLCFYVVVCLCVFCVFCSCAFFLKRFLFAVGGLYTQDSSSFCFDDYQHCSVIRLWFDIFIALRQYSVYVVPI